MTPDELIAKYQAVAVEQSSHPLHGIDEIDWSALQHAYGEASDVPALLRAAISQVENDRKFAFRLLSQTIIHQGTLYEVSPHLVPFLFQLLTSPLTPDKASVALLLAYLASGQSHDAVRTIHNEEGSPFEKDKERELAEVDATWEAVGKQLPLLFPYLQSATASVRADIAAALSLYPDEAATTLPLLRKALASERDAHVVREIERAIYYLTRG